MPHALEGIRVLDLAINYASNEEAARETGMSVGAVYVAKSRVLARLRQRARQIEAEQGEEGPP